MSYCSSTIKKNNYERLLLCIIRPIERSNHKETALFVEKNAFFCKTMHQLTNR